MGCGWWNDSEAGSVGRILHFLYQYCGLMVAEKSVVGQDEVKFCNTHYARIKWEDIEIEGVKLNIPVFDFADAQKNKVQKQYQRTAAIYLKEFRDKVGNNKAFKLLIDERKG